jgi:3-hydroxybutyryl-CoA dehydrogenase
MAKAEKIIVVGSGLMGVGIAHAFVTRGFAVHVIDNNEAALERGKQKIAGIITDGVKLGKVTPADAEQAAARLTGSTALAGNGGDAALLIETATENLAIKQAIMRDAEAELPAEAIIATNTSALSITEIASATKNPKRVAGMHFFNPVQKMKLVEIIRGLETSPEVIERIKDWTAAIGKTSITVNEAPGFTTSRMSAMMGNEAMYMLAEGVASAEDIDTSLRMAFNHPMGPLELGDLTGWDTRLAVLQYLHGVLGEKFRPCPLIIKMVKSGRHGRKTGKGVYEYDAAGNKVPGSGLKVS